MKFIELTLYITKEKISISISKITAIFEINNATRITVIGDGCFDVDESYEIIMDMLTDEK